jgi:hypothetical protein
MDTFNQRPFVPWILVFTLLMVLKLYALHMVRMIDFHKGVVITTCVYVIPCILVLTLSIMLELSMVGVDHDNYLII